MINKFNKGSFERNFLQLFSGNVLSQLVPLVFAPFIGRLYTRDEMGGFSHYVVLAGLISIIAAGRYEYALVLPKSDSHAKNIFALSLLIMVIVVTISGGVFVFEEQLVSFYETADLIFLLKFVFIGVLLLALNSVFTQLSVRNKRFKNISYSKVLLSLILNASTVVLGYLNWGMEGLVVGWLLGNAVGLIPLVIANKDWISKKEVSKGDMKSLAKEYKSFPLINSAHSFTDKFFSEYLLFNVIQLFFGKASLGDYSQMNRYIRRPIGVVGGTVGQVYYKEASEAYNNNKKISPHFLKSLKITFLFALPICGVLFFFGEEIFVLYLSEEWIVAGKCAEVMAIPVFFNFLTSPVSTTQLIFKKQFKAYLLSLVGYLMSISALFAGYYFYGDFIGAIKMFAIGQSAYYILLLIWYFLIIKKSEK